ncbi:hypothetical protein J2S40_003376 [Nocardioides luteus]|nr:hypothetical protein [Nocardioides luteus]
MISDIPRYHAPAITHAGGGAAARNVWKPESTA